MAKYHYRTSVGTVWIKPQPGTDRYWLGIEAERLGSYQSPGSAADDVYTGSSGWPPLDRLPRAEKPRDISEWETGSH
jgi:hypothetical protein